MKGIVTLTLGLTLLAARCAAQTEQWLEYHSSNDGRSYQTMELTTNAPPGIALPALKGVPWFARWQTPMDPAGERWLSLDRTRNSGPCDRLYLDSNGDGRLDDETAVIGRRDSYNTYFPAVPVVFKGPDGPVTYHLVLRFYQYDRSPAHLLASSGGWYEGDVNFDGVKKHLQLIDGNVNGTFNDIAADPYHSDRIRLAGRGGDEQFLGRMLEVDGKFYDIEVARDGAFVKVRPAKDLVFGGVRIPPNISEFSAYGENGQFIRRSTNGEFTLPVGKYRIIQWIIQRKDERGAPWKMTGYNFPADTNFEVVATQPVALEIGEPVQAVLKADEQANRQVRFDLRFVGRQQESIEILRDGQRPRGPKLMLANADGSLCYTNTFEYG